MDRKARAFPATLVLLFCPSGCVFWCGPGPSRLWAEPAEPQTRTVTLGGWVHTEYGQLVPSGVLVHLQTDEGMRVGEQPINTAGYFEFLGLAKTSYQLTVTAPGFRTYQQNLDLGPVGDRLVINVFLSPALKTKVLPPPAPPSFTDNKASKKARKEYEKGSRALRNRNLSGAQLHFESAVKEYPCYVRAQSDLAVVLSEKQQYTESEAALKRAMKCDPDYLDTYSELGQLYYDEKKYQESEVVVQEGLRRSPASWQFYYQLGADYFHLGKYRQAEEEYLKAESLSPSVPAEIHVKLADVYLKQSAYDKAYAEMQGYLRAEPGGRYAPKLKKVMHQMESDHTVQVVHPAVVQPQPPQP